jgi:osmotically-inducible protein OsmY
VLTGVVSTNGDRQLAEARVREVPGVLRVENLIAVEPDGQGCRP